MTDGCVVIMSPGASVMCYEILVYQSAILRGILNGT